MQEKENSLAASSAEGMKRGRAFGGVVELFMMLILIHLHSSIWRDERRGIEPPEKSRLLILSATTWTPAMCTGRLSGFVFLHSSPLWYPAVCY